MAIMQQALCKAPALKSLHFSDGARQIVMGVDAREEGWGAVL